MNVRTEYRMKHMLRLTTDGARITDRPLPSVWFSVVCLLITGVTGWLADIIWIPLAYVVYLTTRVGVGLVRGRKVVLEADDSALVCPPLNLKLSKRDVLGLFDVSALFWRDKERRDFKALMGVNCPAAVAQTPEGIELVPLYDKLTGPGWRSLTSEFCEATRLRFIGGMCTMHERIFDDEEDIWVAARVEALAQLDETGTN